MIAQSQISKLSNRLQKESGGRRIPESVLERDYCVAQFLVGLSRSSLRTKLAFKGGTALKRCHFEDYRFSEDMGFTLLEAGTTLEIIKKEMESIYTEVKSASGITFRFVRDDHCAPTGRSHRPKKLQRIHRSTARSHDSSIFTELAARPLRYLAPYGIVQKCRTRQHPRCNPGKNYFSWKSTR